MQTARAGGNCSRPAPFPLVGGYSRPAPAIRPAPAPAFVICPMPAAPHPPSAVGLSLASAPAIYPAPSVCGIAKGR